MSVVTCSGFYAAVVWTPNGWRILTGGFPSTELLQVYTASGGIVSTLNITGVGALNGLRAAAGPDGTIAWCCQDNANRFVYGAVTPSGSITATFTALEAYGQSGVNVACLDGGFVFYVLQSGTTYVQIVNGVVSAPLPNFGPTSQGWIDVWNGDLRWIDPNRIDKPQSLIFPTTQGAVTLGQDLSTKDRVVGIGPSGRFLVANVLGMEPSIAMSPDGTTWAACWRQLHGQIGIATFPPFPPVLEDDLEIPEFPPARITVIPFDWSYDAPRVTWVGDTDPHAGDVRYVFCTIKAVPTDSDDLGPVFALSKQVNKPVLGCYDERHFNRNAVPWSIEVIGIECYPVNDRGVMEPVDETLSRCRAAIVSCLAVGRRCALITAVYTGSGAWPAPHVLALLRGAWNLAREFSLDVLPFGVVRPPLYPEFYTSVVRMLQAAQGRPGITPKPTPVPVPSKPRPSTRSFTQEFIVMSDKANRAHAQSSLAKHPSIPDRFTIKLPSGKFLCIVEDGSMSEQDNPGGGEAFKYTAGECVAYAPRENGNTYWVPVAPGV